MLEISEQLNRNEAPSIIKQYFWSRNDINNCKYALITFINYLCSDDIIESVVQNPFEFGCEFTTSVSAKIQSAEIAIIRLFPIQQIHFGERSSFADNKESAYINEDLLAHNDNTYFNYAAGLQILRCVYQTESSGENTVTDGVHTFNSKWFPVSYEYLSKTSVRSEYIEDGNHFKHCASVIMVDPIINEPNQIR